MTDQALTHRTPTEPAADADVRTKAPRADVPSASAAGVTAWTPELPGDVGSAEAKLAFLYLWTMRQADVTDLSRVMGIPQIRLLPVLDGLVDRGHVEREGLTFALAAG